MKDLQLRSVRRAAAIVLCALLALTLLQCKKKGKDDGKSKAADDMAIAMQPAPDMRPADMRPVDMRPVDMRPVDMRPAPDMRPVDMRPADMGAAEGMRPAADKPGAKILFGPHKTFSMPDPGDQWVCQTKSVPRQRAAVIKCKPKAPGKLFFVMVKGYDIPDAKPTDFKKLFATVYMKNYKKLFENVKVLEQKKVKIDGRDAYTMAISAKHKRMGEIMQRETALQVKKRVFLITLSGNAERYKKLAPTVGKWVDKFKILMK